MALASTGVVRQHGAYRRFHRSHHGETVWVVGSGASLNHVKPSLLRGEIVIGVNQSVLEWGGRATYLVTNHHPVAAEVSVQAPGAWVITSDVEKVPPEHQQPTELDAPNILTVPTTAQHYGAFDAWQHWPTDPHVLPMGPSSATLALGWAEFVGASHVILLGLDCGELDGRSNLAGHEVPPAEHRHYGLWERALVSSAAVLRLRGIEVYSINPFVTLSLEGHTFAQP